MLQQERQLLALKLPVQSAKLVEIIPNLLGRWTNIDYITLCKRREHWDSWIMKHRWQKLCCRGLVGVFCAQVLLHVLISFPSRFLRARLFKITNEIVGCFRSADGTSASTFWSLKIETVAVGHLILCLMYYWKSCGYSASFYLILNEARFLFFIFHCCSKI